MVANQPPQDISIYQWGGEENNNQGSGTGQERRGKYILIGDKPLKEVVKFKYLGRVLDKSDYDWKPLY